MRMAMRFAGVTFAAGVLLVAFGWWGVETRAGQEALEEMAGMIPFGAGVVGLGLVLLAAVVAVATRWRRRRGAPR